jgi:hypothetical protein
LKKLVILPVEIPQPPQQPPQIQSLPPPIPPQQPQNIQFKKESIIPGFDFDDEEMRKRKAYSKPIPKEFEKAWKSNKPIPSTATSIKSEMDSHS